MLITPHSTILFQGDSITDAGRSREDLTDLGSGYAALAAAWFTALHPASGVRFLNRGISGNRAGELRARWQADCMDLKPDLVSILIGINDTWRRFDSHDPTSAADFGENLGAVLESTRSAGMQIVLLEPFLLPVMDGQSGWRVDLDPKIAVVRRLAAEFMLPFVPLDGLFAAAAAQKPASFWLPDGVHPSLAGHTLIAQAWLKAVNAWQG